ncbi:MAG: YIP1 family protein [Myxococcales bacterium]|nr:YIP1 family protein [Myxococcales bacterium]
MLARCPSCRNTFSTERAGRQNCPACGKPLVVPEQPAAAPGPEAAPEAGTPWERRAELGTWRAWTQTLNLALLEPGKLFAAARIERTSDHLWFAVITTSVFWAIGQVLERAMLSGQREQMRRLLGSISDNPELSSMMQKMIDTQAAANSWPVVIGLSLLTPLFSFIFLYLNAAVTHGFALVLGQSKRGFPATFTACAYSCAPLVLLAVPACGSIVGVIWLVVLTGIGLKETHRISTGGAAATVLTPYVALCCLGFVAAAAMAMVFRNAMGQR